MFRNSGTNKLFVEVFFKTRKQQINLGQRLPRKGLLQKKNNSTWLQSDAARAVLHNLLTTEFTGSIVEEVSEDSAKEIQFRETQIIPSVKCKGGI